MASSVRVIVHTGEHGLEEAADYYAEFPWEPSPAGELILDKSQFVIDVVKKIRGPVCFGTSKLCLRIRTHMLVPFGCGTSLPSPSKR